MPFFEREALWVEWLITRVTPVCFHGEHQSNYPLATVKFPCHFFFEGQGGTQSATGPSTPEFGDPRNGPRRWEWIYIAGWKMDPEWRRISYWKWGYSIAMFTRGYLDVTSVAYKSNGIYNWWDFRFRYVWTNWRPWKVDNVVPKLIVIMTSLTLLGFVRWGTKPFMDLVSSWAMQKTWFFRVHRGMMSYNPVTWGLNHFKDPVIKQHVFHGK